MSLSAGFPDKLHKVLTTSAVPLGAARTAIGLALLAKPALMAQSLGVDAATAQRTTWITKMFASRDMALGIGSAAGSRGCQLAACASDASDLVAVLLALRARHVKPVPALLTAITAGGAALVGGAGLLASRG